MLPAIAVHGMPYRELVHDLRRPFQTFAAMPVHDRIVGVAEGCPYWMEDADAWLSHDLEPTSGDRVMEFEIDRDATLAIMTRGIAPFIMLDGHLVGESEFMRTTISRGFHRLVWKTCSIVNPQRGDGFAEPVQTAAWLTFHSAPPLSTKDDRKNAMTRKQ